MFIDVIETINLIIPSSSVNIPQHRQHGYGKYSSSYYNGDNMLTRKQKPILATVDGVVDFKNSLSGTPTIELQFAGSLAGFGVPSFHRCVNIPGWISKPDILLFTPPDDKFTLMQYQLNLLDDGGNIWNNLGLVDVELVSGLGANGSGIDSIDNEFEIKVNIKLLDSVKFIENLTIEIFLPEKSPNEEDDDGEGPYVIKTLRLTHGDLVFKKGKYIWEFDKQQVTGISCVLKGKIGTEAQLNETGVTGSSSADLVEMYDNGDINKSKKATIIKPRFLKVNYTNKGSVPSNLKVKTLKVLSGLKANVKPFKGVKYITKTGDFTIR
ncbi:unnamed protein product [Ambrosiozyma monospora]|uniref:Unnamed protein product n=1 Tax=Ambrosiozyma monospora TaxID=43982 RepID=A0A9W6Z1R2_AMBMO|nr:unnamed protein product [Ambrosiozyma monospora]